MLRNLRSTSLSTTGMRDGPTVPPVFEGVWDTVGRGGGEGGDGMEGMGGGLVGERTRE